MNLSVWKHDRRSDWDDEWRCQRGHRLVIPLSLSKTRPDPNAYALTCDACLKEMGEGCK